MFLAQFIIRHPEFRPVPTETIVAALDAAGKELNATEIGEPFDEAHGLLAAHKLALSPMGRNARMVRDDGTSTYGDEFKAVLGRSVTAASVVGGLVPILGCAPWP